MRHDTLMDAAPNIIKVHVDLSTKFGENISTNGSIYERISEVISLGLYLLEKMM